MRVDGEQYFLPQGVITRQWYRYNKDGSNKTLLGTTSDHLTLTSALIGYKIQCVITN